MNINHLKALLASALIMLPGIAGAARWNNSEDAKLPQSSRRVVMMGNSITEYWQWHDVNNHKEFFTDNGALDRGIAGEKTNTMVTRFQADVIDMHPIVVVIGGGVNDINDRVPVDDVVANNTKMALAAARAGIRPIMTTINPSGWSFETVDRYREYNRKIKAWCEENGYSFCNYFDAVKMSDTQYNEMKPEYRGRADHSDHLHPSRQGYIAMESVLIPLIEMNIWNNGTYEAEYAVKKGSGLTDRTLAAASKGQYVSITSNTDTLKLGYNAQKATGYSFTVTYNAAQSGTLAILVNGKPVTVNVMATNGSLSTATVTLNLNRGYNTIAVVNEGSTAVGVDKFTIKDDYQFLADAYKIGEAFPRYSILGDSFSTFKGYMDTGGVNDNGTWYPNDDIQQVEQTWWWQYQNLTGEKLAQNNSISGSCVSYIGLNHSGTVKTPSFVNRAPKMNKATDLIIIEGGTNDKNTANMLGDYQWDNFKADDPNYKYFRPALGYVVSTLRKQHPDALLVFMMNDALPDDMKTSIRTIMSHWGMPTFEMRDIPKFQGGGASGVHPTEAGMTMIAEQLTDFLLDYIKGLGTTEVEAESANFIGTPEVQNDAKASGGKTVKNLGNGNWLSFNAKEKAEGFYNLQIICTSIDSRSTTVIVNDDDPVTVHNEGNGGGDRIRFGADTLNVVVRLNVGDNIIKIGSDTEECPLIDKIKILRNDALEEAIKVEAESCDLIGTATKSNDNHASGGKTVTQLGNGGWISYDFNAPASGYYMLRVNYVCADNSHLDVEVNGKDAGEVSCEATGANKARGGINQVTKNIYLNYGKNTIRLGNKSVEAPIIDSFTLQFIGTTGIKGISNTTAGKPSHPTAIYNLAGQQVDSSYKGIVISGGRKYIKK